MNVHCWRHEWRFRCWCVLCSRDSVPISVVVAIYNCIYTTVGMWLRFFPFVLLEIVDNLFAHVLSVSASRPSFTDHKFDVHCTFANAEKNEQRLHFSRRASFRWTRRSVIAFSVCCSFDRAQVLNFNRFQHLNFKYINFKFICYRFPSQFHIWKTDVDSSCVELC